MDDYLAINRANWDDRAPLHAAAPDYAVARLVSDPEFLSHVVRFDRDRLGNVAGLRGAHLQCHIGTDTISLARLGARMTGLDLSPASLREARALAAATGTDVRFVESDLYSAPRALDGATFELVYTGIGALCWLPSVARWGEVVAELLAPGGRLFIREGHPMLWTLVSDPDSERLIVEDPYFERAEPLVYDEPSSYVETAAPIAHGLTHEWNHGLGEIVASLLDNGLRITGLVEHDSVPWQALERGMRRTGVGDEWQLIDRPWRVPHSYTLQAIKPR